MANVGTLTLTGSPVLDNVANGANATGGGRVEQRHAERHQQPDPPQCRDRHERPRRRHLQQRVGTTTLQSVTVVSNRAVGSGANGGGVFRSGGTVTLSGSSVAANQPNNCGNPSTVTGCS